jgi:hypothetical protein
MSAEPSSAASAGPDGRTVTLADDGTTIDLAIGDRFLLNLGRDFNWTVSVDDQSVLSRVPNIAVIQGAQGIYLARAPGHATLSATGDPPCRKATPPCGAPSRLFRVHMTVHP